MALGSSVPLGNPEYRSAAPTWTLTKKGKCTRQRGFQGNHKGHRTVRSYFANNSGKVRECPYPREEAGRSELGAGNGRDGRWDAKGKLQTPDNVHKVERTRPCGSGRNSSPSVQSPRTAHALPRAAGVIEPQGKRRPRPRSTRGGRGWRGVPFFRSRGAERGEPSARAPRGPRPCSATTRAAAVPPATFPPELSPMRTVARPGGGGGRPRVSTP